MPLLAACTPGRRPAGRWRRAVRRPQEVDAADVCPLANLPAAELPGTPDGLLAPGYPTYPSNLIKSVPQPPGKAAT